MTHRSWFPTILFGLSLILAVVFLFFTKHGSLSFSQVVREPVATAVSAEDYHVATNIILDAYAKDHDAQKAYNALVLLRLPGSEQQTHFDLVVAFSKLGLKDTKDGQSRLQALKASHDWLHL